MPIINKKTLSDKLRDIFLPGTWKEGKGRWKQKPYDFSDLKKQYGRFWRVHPNDPIHKSAPKPLPFPTEDYGHPKEEYKCP